MTLRKSEDRGPKTKTRETEDLTNALVGLRLMDFNYPFVNEEWKDHSTKKFRVRRIIINVRDPKCFFIQLILPSLI